MALNQTERDILTLFLESDSIKVKPSQIIKELDEYPAPELHEYTLSLWIEGFVDRDSWGYSITQKGCKALLNAYREGIEE